MQRWLIRIFLTVATMLLIAGACIQGVLWSDLPRHWTLQELQRTSGLIIDADTFHSGWLGRTTLKNVTIAMPLEDGPLATIAEMRVRHTAVIPMLFRRGIDVESIHIAQPSVRVHRDEYGEWNILQAAERAFHTMNANGSQRAASNWPSVRIVDARVDIEANGRTVQITGIEVDGVSNQSHDSTFALQVPAFGHAQGKVAIGWPWHHQLTFEARGIDRVLHLLQEGDAIDSINAKGSWQGRIANDTLVGRVTLDAANVDATDIIGSASIQFGNGRISIDDTDLLARNPRIASVRLTGGNTHWSDSEISTRDVRLASNGVTASLNGEHDFMLGSTSFDAEWLASSDASGLPHRGTVHGSVARQVGGSHVLIANVNACSEPTSTAATWTTDAVLRATGSSWQNLEGTISFPRFIWKDEAQSIDLSGCTAALVAAWPLIEVRDLRMPAAQGAGQASFNGETDRWNAQIQFEDWKLPTAGLDLPPNAVDVRLLASGNWSRIDVEDLELSNKQFRFASSGSYSANSEPPLRARATISSITAMASAVEPKVPLATSFQGNAEIHGSLMPIELALSGTFTGENIRIGHRMFVRIAAPLTGSATNSHLHFQASEIETLGGRVSIDGHMRWADGVIRATVSAQNVTIEDAADVFAFDAPVSGTATVSGLVTIATRNPELISIENGSWSLHGVRGSLIDISSATGVVSMRNDVLSLNDIDVQNSDGVGQFRGIATANVSNQKLTASFESTNWPILLNDHEFAFQVNGKGNIEYAWDAHKPRGDAALTGSINHSQNSLGHFALAATATDTAYRVSSLDGEFAGGTFKATGEISTSDWSKSHGKVDLLNIDLATLSQLHPSINSLAGMASLHATIAPTPAEDRLSPSDHVRVDARVDSHEAKLNGLQIGNASLLAYVGRRSVLINRSQASVAGGAVALQGRLSWHGNEPFAQITAHLTDLDLDQLARWNDPDVGPVPGLVNGWLTAGGYLHAPHRLFGHADVTLIDSDLVNVPVFSMIYDGLNLSFGKIEPQGKGRAVFQLEGNSLHLSRMEYFNRGTDVVGALTIDNIWRGSESPLTGVAIGAARPLKNIDLPFFNDLDRAIKAIQTGAASVEIGGTLGEPTQRLVPFAEISDAFHGILTGSPQ